MTNRTQQATERPAEPSDAVLQAIRKWKAILGDDRVETSDTGRQTYEQNETCARRRVVAVLKPKSSVEVAEVVRIANQYRVPIYPVSTGKNWGYGGASPVADDCAVVDLSRMTSIVDFDDELGLVTVEPGVTQQQLYEFLRKRQARFLVPVTGAGPHCSLLANALERGYGVTPVADHFAAVTSIEAILPDGSIYHSALDDLGGHTVNAAHKWGLGPYLDGLFTQSSFGIVTRGTIALAPIPECVEAFLVSLKSEESLDHAVNAVREILRSTSGASGSINIMNGRRMLAMMDSYPRQHIGSDGVLTDDAVRLMLRANGLTEWTVGGMIHGDRAVVRAFKRLVKRGLKPIASRTFFFGRRRIETAGKLARLIPGGTGTNLRRRLSRLSEMFKAAEGIPTEAALPLCYWKSGQGPSDDQQMNPALDGCGVIWYSPLVPMRSADVLRYTDMVNRVCREHGIEPLITLTSLSERCFDSTVPLLFDPTDSDETARARACYDALFEAGRAMGFLPYRVGIDQMDKIVDGGTPFWQAASKIKKALDTHGIIAPGRYCPDFANSSQSRPKTAPRPR